MRNTSIRKSSELAQVADGLALMDELTGPGQRLWEAIQDARLVLQVAAVLHKLREQRRFDAHPFDLWSQLSATTLARLEREPLKASGLARLRRLARELELDVRLVLVPRRREGRGARLANIARLR